MVTRNTQKTDTIYVIEDFGGDTIFVTPDGEGRFFYDTLEEAQDEHGYELPVVYIDTFED